MKRLILILFALCSLTVGAQTAKSVLDKTASILSSYPSCSAKFQATMGQGTTQGTITIQDRRFMVKSKEALVWFDGKTQWMYMPSTNEVNVTNPTTQEIQRMNPYYFLNIYKNGYELSMKTVGKDYVVTLTAQKGQGLNKMEVTINQKTYLPSRVVMISRKGSRSTINISSIKQGKKNPDSAFRFNKKEFPKAQVIDLR